MALLAPLCAREDGGMKIVFVRHDEWYPEGVEPMGERAPTRCFEPIDDKAKAYEFLTPKFFKKDVEVVIVADDVPMGVWQYEKDFPKMELLYRCCGQSAFRDWKMAVALKRTFEEAFELEAVSKQPCIKREMRSL